MRRPPAITIMPFAGACSGALSKATGESATTIAGTATKATQISLEEIPANRPAEAASDCTAYLEPERRGWPASGGWERPGSPNTRRRTCAGRLPAAAIQCTAGVRSLVGVTGSAADLVMAPPPPGASPAPSLGHGWPEQVRS